jgi:hypothetical protein
MNTIHSSHMLPFLPDGAVLGLENLACCFNSQKISGGGNVADTCAKIPNLVWLLYHRVAITRLESFMVLFLWPNSKGLMP